MVSDQKRHFFTGSIGFELFWSNNTLGSNRLKKRKKNLKKSLENTEKSSYLCTPQEGKFITN
jgi:hypothetical protein